MPPMRPVIQPIYSTLLMVIGVALITNPDSFPPGPYTYTFRLFGPVTWGWVLLNVGLFAFGAFTAPDWGRWTRAQFVLACVATALQCATMLAWAGFLTVAAFDPDLTVSVAGPAMWTAGALANMVALWRIGHGRPRR